MKNCQSSPTADQSLSSPVETPLAYRVARGGLWIAASSYFNLGFGFLANLALTRILAPEHFGVFALASFFFSLLNLRPKVSVGYAFAQRKETTGDLLGTYVGLEVTSGLLTLLVAAIAVPVLRAFGYPTEVVWIVLALAVAGVLESLYASASTLLGKELQFGQVSIVYSLAFAVSYVPGLWLAINGAGYWSLVAQNLTNAVLLTLGLGWAVRRGLPHLWRLHWRFDRRLAIDLVRFGAVVGIATLTASVVFQFDNFLVGTFVGVAALGFYDRAYRIAQWPSQLVSGAMNTTAFYTYARLQDDRARLQRSVIMTLWLVTSAAVPLALAVFASAPDLVGLLYGDRWHDSALFLRFLVVFSLIRPVLELAGSLFIAVNEPRKTTITATTQAVVMVIVATPLTLTHGAVGTCIGVGISFMVALVVGWRYIARIVGMSLKETLATPFVAVLVAMTAYVILTRALDLNDLALAVRVFIKAGFVVAAYFGTTMAIQPRQSVQRVRYVLALLRGRRLENEVPV